MVRLVDALVAATIVLIAESISFGLRSEWSVHYLWIPAVVFACGFVAFAVERPLRLVPLDPVRTAHAFRDARQLAATSQHDPACRHRRPGCRPQRARRSD